MGNFAPRLRERNSGARPRVKCRFSQASIRSFTFFIMSVEAVGRSNLFCKMSHVATQRKPQNRQYIRKHLGNILRFVADCCKLFMHPFVASVWKFQKKSEGLHPSLRARPLSWKRGGALSEEEGGARGLGGCLWGWGLRSYLDQNSHRVGQKGPAATSCTLVIKIATPILFVWANPHHRQFRTPTPLQTLTKLYLFWVTFEASFGKGQERAHV